MTITIDSETAQAAFDKINAVKDAINALPDGPEKDAAAAAEADLHSFANDEFLAAGGTYISGEQSKSRSVQTGSGPVIFSGGTNKNEPPPPGPK